ncbi:MAG: 3'(2'),5'-bisphosphate nucleotidase CysQ [Hyphomicrobiales bacterium]|nr:3'(2'),5'-bisphosphate nucleotidase CysQ [Hyphomicrobiales bacterium]
MRDIEDDFSLLLDAVREAGDLAHARFRSKVKSWRKDDGSFVTEADYAANELLEARLAKARPSYGWLSEETVDDGARLLAQRVWIVDPIDGTQAFLNGETDWCVCAALVEDGEPICAAVYSPARARTFAARKGAGATLNGAPLRSPHRSSLEGARVIASKNLLAPKNWRAPLPRLERVWANSIAYRISMVAAGEAEVVLAFTPKWEWDVAAAALIAREAGCEATDGEGAPLRFNAAKPRCDGLLIASPPLHRLLLARKKPVEKQLQFHLTGEDR